MQYLKEYRQNEQISALAASIAANADADKTYRIMEFCGGHTHALYRYGLPDLLPKPIELIHGPGCPVCVLPVSRLDKAIAISTLPKIIFCSYGDMLRVPASKGVSLLNAKAEGADIRMIYSVEDALTLAAENPNQEIVFFAIGFETTAPMTAAAVQKAAALKVKNFSVYCNHLLTPPAFELLLQLNTKIDGFIGPGHVCTVIGSSAFDAFCRKYQSTMVISGFEPFDMMQSINSLVQRINQNTHNAAIQYKRAVTPAGNLKAQKIMQDVFDTAAEFEWRGIGSIPFSAMRIKDVYQNFDAEHRFKIPPIQSDTHTNCCCGEILIGKKKPTDCLLFGRTCSPENPIGACMVSAEGACAAVYKYRKL